MAVRRGRGKDDKLTKGGMVNGKPVAKKTSNAQKTSKRTVQKNKAVEKKKAVQNEKTASPERSVDKIVHRFTNMNDDPVAIGSYRILKGDFRDFKAVVAKALLKGDGVKAMIKTGLLSYDKLTIAPDDVK